MPELELIWHGDLPKTTIFRQLLMASISHWCSVAASWQRRSA